MGTKVTKVGEMPDTESVDEKKKEKGRAIFDIAAYGTEVADSVDADGCLTVVPTTFNIRKNKPMKKEHFATEALYIRYQAAVATQKAEHEVAKAADLIAKAERVEKFGSDESRKTANKLAKAVKSMATLRAKLIEDGDMTAEAVDDLIKNMP
jgi:Uri superfamily endonuclease